MEIIVGSGKSLPSELIEKLGLYRHRVFVGRLGWKLPCEHGFEFDEFDRDDTVHVIGMDPQGSVIGCARLLPTTRPYLLASVFPHLLGDQEIPCSPAIWELSRFAAVDFSSEAAWPHKQFSSPNAATLLRRSVACARSMGAHRLVSVSPTGVERLLEQAGFHWARIGEPVSMKSGFVVAGEIGMDEKVVPAARSRAEMRPA